MARSYLSTLLPICSPDVVSRGNKDGEYWKVLDHIWHFDKLIECNHKSGESLEL